MSKLVRATLPNGASTTVSEAYAKRHGLKYADKGATDAHGRVRRAVGRTDKAGRPINASMSREDLEAAAVEAGIPADQASAAANKGELVAAINHATGEPADGTDIDTEA